VRAEEGIEGRAEVGGGEVLGDGGPGFFDGEDGTGEAVGDEGGVAAVDGEFGCPEGGFDSYVGEGGERDAVEDAGGECWGRIDVGMGLAWGGNRGCDEPAIMEESSESLRHR